MTRGATLEFSAQPFEKRRKFEKGTKDRLFTILCTNYDLALDE
jgi:hypothetical protein